MFKILIVDDERIIREGIGESLQECGGFIVSYASDGQEALEVCKSQNFDAMLIDIVMPRMNGLELLQRLSDLDNDAIKIIISAHDDFAYAKEAMANNASDYFLKPFYPSDVKLLAENLTAAILKRHSRQEKYKSLMKQVEESRDIIRVRLLDDLLNDRIDHDDFLKQQIFLGGEFLSGRYRVMMVRTRFEQMSANMDPNEYQARLMDISDALGQLIKNHRNCVLISSHSQVFTFLFNIPGGSDPENEEEKLFSDIRDVLSDQNVTVCGGIGGIVNEITYIKYSFREASVALKYNFSSFRNNTLDISDIQHNRLKTGHYFDEEAFSSNMKLGNRAAVEMLLNEMDDLVRSSDDKISFSYVELTLIHMLVNAITVLLESDEDGYQQIEKRYYNMLNELRSIELLPVKVKKTKCILLEIVEIIQNARENQNSKTIEKVKQYIQSRYKENIFLNDIAEDVFLSKNYLGQLFKQKTGMNIIDYIHRTRISKARELIENSDLKLYEVAGAVGYEDQHYFSSIFKRLVGVTPSEYRDTH